MIWENPQQQIMPGRDKNQEQLFKQAMVVGADCSLKPYFYNKDNKLSMVSTIGCQP